MALILYPSITWANRPNIVLIVADDLGYTDIGAFGSEIKTPNIDKLSNQGLRLTRFYTSPLCSPTRSMLMSGTDNHLAGLGTLSEARAANQQGRPGYEGFLNHQVVSLGALMKDAGYHTYMAGKWHLGSEVDLTPTARGFERSFALLTGSADHFNDMVGPSLSEPKAKYWRDGKRVYSLPNTFYSSDFYTSRLLEYIDENIDDNKPFFAYLAFTAPHWPLQAPERSMMKYRGKYSEGWDIIRAKRFEESKRLGIIPGNATLPPRPSFIPAWDSLDNEAQKREARLMEVYAAMVDRMDFNIGRVINYLKRQSLYKNTYIVFFSDNGAEAFQLRNLPVFANWHKRFDSRFESIGRRGSFSFYGAGWAQAGEAPFRLTKGFTTEGGIRSPAIIVDPKRRLAGEINNSVVTVMDILPTFLDIAQAKLPGNRYKGKDIHPPVGSSLLSLIKGKNNTIRDNDAIFGMEMYNNRAIVKGKWKLVMVNKPFGNAKWELFDLSIDPGEQHDIAQLKPKKLRKLIDDWKAYVITNHIVLPEGPPLPNES